MLKIKKRKSISGQALVETVLSTVILIVFTFATLQLILVVINELVANEGAFSISRVAVVSKRGTRMNPQRNIDRKTRIAAVYLFGRHIDLNNLSFVPYDCPVEGRSTDGAYPGSQAMIYSTVVKYVQSVMFGYLFSGDTIMSIGNRKVLKSVSRCRMVASPDEDYYEKAYPNAPRF